MGNSVKIHSIRKGYTMNLFDQLLEKLQNSKGTDAIGTFTPEGETQPVSYIVTGYRLSNLPGQVVLVSRRGSVWPVSEARWQAEFKRAGDLLASEVTPG